MPTDPDIGIARCSDVDRPMLSRLCPTWFRSHQPTTSWAAVRDGEVLGAILLQYLDGGRVSFELNAASEDEIEACASLLLDHAAEEARTSGATMLDADVDSLASNRHEALLLRKGFVVHETFDTFTAPRVQLEERLARIVERTKGRIKSRIDAEIVEMEEKHLDAVAVAMAAWIGGSASRGIFQIRQQFHQRGRTDPQRRLQLVAIHENRVVGFSCTSISSPGVLKIDGEGTDPRYRLDPMQTMLTLAMYERAREAGIETITFEAGSRQPNTRAMATRNRIESIKQRRHLRLELA